MTTNHAPRNASNPFAIISSSILRNPDLSSIECRVMSILLNLPQGWQPNVKHLSTQMREGTSAIQRAIARLKQFGYLVCRSIRDATGRFLRSDWEINEIPMPPSHQNIDVRGNVVAVDRGGKSPKNLRREAKQRVKSGQRSVSKPQAGTFATTTFDPYTENPYTDNPNTGFDDRSNIDIPNIHLNLEREVGAGVERRGEEPGRDLGLRLDKKPEFFTQPEVLELDKNSATAEFAEIDLNNFKTQLEDLGKNLGRRSPIGWAFTIVQNLRAGKSSTYWDEFKAGIPLGTSDQREWEIAPGVACAIAVQCLEQDYLARPGTTPQEAALKAARTIARPKEMAAVWESIKSQVMFRRSEWEKQSALGVQSPVIDSWMMPKPAVTVEEVAIALKEIQPTSVVALPATASSNQELLSAAVLVESVEIVEGTIKQPAQSGEETAGIIAEAKAKISAALGKFARPGKKRAILEANMAEAKEAGRTMPVAKPLSSSGGLADYLRWIEVAEDDIW